MLILALLPIVLRLALLKNNPVPIPEIADDFSNLLLGDTLAHFRLANPPHPMSRFFEAAFVLQDPTYSSIYPPGQGLLLALGELLFGAPWAGILFASGLLCALCCWALRAWTTSLRALAGGLLSVLLFGPLAGWTNQYWGGFVSGVAGCLVFGSLWRARQTQSVRWAFLLGLGLALQLLSRPFEFLLLAGVALVYLRKQLFFRMAPIAFAVMAPAALLLLAQNKAVTGHWTTLPYMLSRQQYGVPTSFVFEPLPKPTKHLTPEQQADFEAQSDTHDDIPNTFVGFWRRWAERLPDYHYFFPTPLLFTLPFVLLSIRTSWPVLAIPIFFSFGTNFYPYFYPNYVAALIPLFLAMTVTSLANLGQIRITRFPAGKLAMGIITTVCIGQFVWNYGARAAGADVTYEDRNRRTILHRLAQSPGNPLVFVRIGDDDDIHQWIQNGAAIDRARVVWALDLGAEEDKKLIAYYPGRTAWLLIAKDWKLEPYK